MSAMILLGLFWRYLGSLNKPEACFGKYWSIGFVGNVFVSDLGDQCSIPGQVIPKTQKKCYLMPPCLILNIIKYGSSVKWNNPGNEVVPSPISQCSSYCKGSLRVTLDYDRQLYLLYFYLIKATLWPLFLIMTTLQPVCNMGKYW